MTSRNVVLSIVLAFVGTMAFRVCVPVAAFHAREVLGASATMVGALMAAFFAARAPAALTAGFLYRGGGRVRLVVPVCFLGAGLVSLLYGAAGSLWQLLVLRAVHGLLLGYAWTSVQVIVGASTPSGMAGTVYAVYFAAGYLAMPAADTVYAMASGEPHRLLRLSATLFTASALLSALLEPPRLATEKPRKSRRRAGRTGACLAPVALVVLLVFLIRLSTAFTMSDVAYIALSEQLGLTRSATAKAMAAASLAGLPLSILLGIVADKVSERLAVLTVGAMAGLGLALLPHGSLHTAVAGLALLLTAGRLLTPISRRIAITRAKAKGIGVVSTAGNTGTLVSSLTAGAVYDTLARTREGLATASLAAAALVLAAATLLAASLPSHTRQQPSQD